MSELGPHLSLPESAREAMREPLGPVVVESDLVLHLKKTDLLVAVGDMVTLTLERTGYPTALAIFDYKTLREEGPDFRSRLGGLEGERLRARNPAGTITRELWDTVQKAFSRVEEGARVLLEVEGEEDLAAIPAILLAPAGARVLYGMPGKGVVVVTVNKPSRNAARRLQGMLEPKEGWSYSR